jgi:leucyl aminopeptidase
MSALPVASSIDINNAVRADSISVGYSKNADGEFEFIGSLISELEQHFQVNFSEQLVFFAPTGKAGELFEIPVGAPDAKTERIFLVSLGDQSAASLRSAGAAIGRKVRGKNTTVYSTISQEKDHAISMTLGAWMWNMKTGKKDETPTIQIATHNKKTIETASVIAKAVCRARDLIHTPANIKNPAWMAKQVEEFAQGTGLKVQILSGSQLKEFGGLRAVGGSSPKPGPRMIQISYSPKRAVKSVRALPHVVLVGK